MVFYIGKMQIIEVLFLFYKQEAFKKQIDKWIKDDVAAIRDYADGKDNDFQAGQGNAVAWGIIA